MDVEYRSIDTLTPYVKSKISVSGRCSDYCPFRRSCRYLAYLAQAQSPTIDIQVCNHNYLLADTLHRANRQLPLIPNYQSLIVDEAHKFLAAARSMYSIELSSLSLPNILETVDRLRFKRVGFQSLARKTAKKLFDESERLFHGLLESIAKCDDGEDDSDRFPADINETAARHLRNIRAIIERLIIIMRDETFYDKAEELLAFVSRHYNANTSRIRLQDLLSDTACCDGTREGQEKLMSEQIISIYRAICLLPEIRRISESERRTRRIPRSFRGKPEHMAVRNDRAPVTDALWHKTQRLLPVEKASGNTSEWTARLIWSLQQILDQASAFIKQGNLICWLEADGKETKICAIPKSLDRKLFSDQWKKGIPTVLTSGTLSAGGDFSHVKRLLGLDYLNNRLTETSKPSPFNHRENALLYISENVPFPNRRDKQYIDAVADECERLVKVSHGHAAVLFTSYKAMDMVWERLKRRGLPFPMFRLDKGGIKAIEQFKQSGNGVLFASGALWEGIDIPGDALSMLIIVKLPFAVPDPISEYEQTLYKDMTEYKERVVVPEMLIKLKQGFGRLIRSERDTGAVAILDCRANLQGAYRARVLGALPDCRVTSDIADIEKFIIAKKGPEYFT
jgi:Rad3-related DNA helicase